MHTSGWGWQGAGLAAVLLSSQSQAGQAPAAPQDVKAELAHVKQLVAQQRRELDELRLELAAQRAALPAAHPASVEQLGSARGTGNAQAAGAGGAKPASASNAKPGSAGATAQADTPAHARAGEPGATNAPMAQRAPAPAQAQHAAPRAPVGRPPQPDKRPPQIAPLFEQPGVLTPRGKYIIEPGFQFGYASSNRVALVGYTVIPALLIGLIDVREVKRNTSTASLTVRTGLTNRLEAELRLPWVYRSDSTVSREIFTGTAVERVFDTSGRGAGDAEVAARYQINDGGADKPYYIGSLRFKSRTGQDPFEVITDCNRRCIGDNATGTGLPLELPTGSGFYSLQPSLTWLFPSDPAVFFGSISYLHNFQRSDVSRTVLNGEQEFLGDVKPGAILGFNFGMGLALNDKASFSLGYDHNSIGRTRQGGTPVPSSVRTQLGTLLLGYSYRLSDQRTLNVSLGAGLTRDTPDVTLSIRVPLTY